LVTLPRILARHILKERELSSARMILITPGTSPGLRFNEVSSD
jgi:hypothetical protein